jgi:hypothetical protein
MPEQSSSRSQRRRPPTARLTDRFTVPRDTTGWEREPYCTFAALEAAEVTRLDALVAGAEALLRMVSAARDARCAHRNGDRLLEERIALQLDHLLDVYADETEQREPA